MLERVSVPSLATPPRSARYPESGTIARGRGGTGDVSIEETFGTFGNGASTTVSPFGSFFSVTLEGSAAAPHPEWRSLLLREGSSR